MQLTRICDKNECEILREILIMFSQHKRFPRPKWLFTKLSDTARRGFTHKLIQKKEMILQGNFDYKIRAYLSTSKFKFISIHCVIFFHLNNETTVTKTDLIKRNNKIHFGKHATLTSIKSFKDPKPVVTG